MTFFLAMRVFILFGVTHPTPYFTKVTNPPLHSRSPHSPPPIKAMTVYQRHKPVPFKLSHWYAAHQNRPIKSKHPFQVNRRTRSRLLLKYDSSSTPKHLSHGCTSFELQSWFRCISVSVDPSSLVVCPFNAIETMQAARHARAIIDDGDFVLLPK